MLKNIGIKVWVLTGDKIETAINIGLMAGLLDNNTSKIILDDENTVEQKLQNAVKLTDKSWNYLQEEFALIIAGSVMTTIEKSSKLNKLLLTV